MAFGVGTNYTDTYNSYSDVTADKLKEGLSTRDLTSATDDELMQVCKDFEAYLVEQMYKAMEKTIMKDEEAEESGSDAYISGYKDYFGDMKIQQYAKLATENSGLGIAQMLYEQLKVNVAGTIPQAAEK